MEITHGRRVHRVVRSTLTVLLTLVLAVTTLVSTHQPAEAATRGHGYGTWDNRIGWQGGFIAPDGSMVYCIEPGVDNPSGATASSGHQSSVVSNTPFGSRTLSSDDLAKINFLVTEFGQTSSDREASAVNFAVKYIANPGAKPVTFFRARWSASRPSMRFFSVTRVTSTAMVPSGDM